MKRLIRPVNATSNPIKKHSFTPLDVLSLLKEITELQGKSIEIQENKNGNIQYIIDDEVYTITEK